MKSLHIAISGGIIGMLGYGMADFFTKNALNKFGYKKTLIYSQTLTLLFLLFYFLIFKKFDFSWFTLHNFLSIIFFGVANGMIYLLVYKAYHIGKISLIAPIVSAYGIVSAFISFLFFNETISYLKLIFICLIVMGIILASFNIDIFKADIKDSAISKGVPYALLFLLICGSFYPFWDKFLEAKPWGETLFLSKIFVVLSIILSLNFVKSDSLPRIEGKDYIFIFLVGVLEAAALIGTSWAFGSSSNSTSIIVAIMSACPVVTILLAQLFLKERLSFNQYLGIFFIFLGLFLMPLI